MNITVNKNESNLIMNNFMSKGHLVKFECWVLNSVPILYEQSEFTNIEDPAHKFMKMSTNKNQELSRKSKLITIDSLFKFIGGVLNFFILCFAQRKNSQIHT